ncbi:hypothetical protein COV06_01840 [Candidatus Uhrbacteria bacterium CG10_big_fil_rev_8_21_14_0_10_50_16]|uniref:DUF3006 domain-containing protein n=1 Tax=Candidatus Uhrbacteria bacterium CG10_big_fil_rev_8_21_14_0_10_50_16 TaxID=1975039 RepID=A0A2H0RMP8_9BACT|nr:MAG: hypothetical protein COV06_01840 [Candidatus Uhrbacteria bacterium CG10_big_fil_rev_8_21_14_0_10_50_16]
MLSHARPAIVTNLTDSTMELTLDDVSLTWPKSEFQEISLGDTLYLVPFTKAGLEEERNEIAKSLLNTVLNPTHEDQPQGE